jgi:hypothetical protein
MVFHRFDDQESAIVLDQAQWQTADGKDWVRSERGINIAGPVVHIHQVVEYFAFGVPEAGLEGIGEPRIAGDDGFPLSTLNDVSIRRSAEARRILFTALLTLASAGWRAS